MTIDTEHLDVGIGNYISDSGWAIWATVIKREIYPSFPMEMLTSLSCCIRGAFPHVKVVLS